MRRSRPQFLRCNSGQALVETALVMPVVLIVLFNAINFGYFFLVALNITAAPRSGVEHAINGGAAASGEFIPTAASIRSLTVADLTGSLANAANTDIQVCTKWSDVGPLQNPGSASQRAACVKYPSGTTRTFGGVSSDPESPRFILHRVDVTYSFNPIISATPFNLVLLASPVCSSSGGRVTCHFHRQTSMRAMD